MEKNNAGKEIKNNSRKLYVWLRSEIRRKLSMGTAGN